ncbi:type 1 glutamine amidotransferase [Leucobacter sp. W1153]|uniref:type 1 glutamine amidotransferase n=1 Tax=Leucobacter sp. W1153 TaxID=3439064 RepID=UPI003F389500
MSGARVLVVEHQSDAGLGLVGERLRESDVEIVTVGPDAGEPIPDSLQNFDALIVLGGSMGPTQDDVAPWLPATRKLLAEGVAEGLPTLGICLGAQLLATATGGHVRTMPGGPEVGVHGVHFHESAAQDPLFAGFAGDTLPAVQWHWLEADELPENTRVLASNSACPNQAFRIGERAWGVQFHPEALGDTAQDWADDGKGDLDEIGLEPEAVVGSVRAAEADLREAWSQVADRFIEVIRASTH